MEPETAEVSYTRPIPIGFKRSKLHCSASWDDKCKDSAYFYVPPGYQACWIDYDFEWDGDVDDLDITPAGWYTNDPQNPDRFRGFRINVKARGNGNLIDPERGRVWVKNIVIIGIGSYWDNKARFEAGCHLPENPNEVEGVEIPPLPD